jgi:ADP-ribosyl-[dinitrogen reductase] hydrolase
MSEDPALDRALGCLLGLAVGDAIGTTLEFAPRDEQPPVSGMTGGGPFGLPAGCWTDDTSMALCLADSLLQCGQLDERDLMDRFVRWWLQGHNSSVGECFDIGSTTREALTRYRETGEPIAGSTDPRSAGNGSLMRVAPVAIRWHRNRVYAEEMARRQSRVTHAAATAVEACALFTELLVEALGGAAREAVLAPRPWSEGPSEIASIAAGSFHGRTRDSIRSSGWVVDTLEAALWCVATMPTFEEAVLTAANLGGDADTVAAVTGQLAGALEGASAIPDVWLAKLALGQTIESRARALWLAGAGS